MDDFGIGCKTIDLASEALKKSGASQDETMRVFRSFNAWAEPFKKESEIHDEEKK